MKIQNLTPGGYASNCYLVTSGHTAVLIDCTAPAACVTEALQKANTTLTAILLTHGHFDHMLTVAEVKAATGAAIYLSRGDEDLPADGAKNAFSLFFGFERAYPTADHLFDDGASLTFGDMRFNVMCTPGHTRGSSLFLIDDIAFTGDTVFAAGYGRYDLFGGDPLALRKSLSAIATLPATTTIYPGHGAPARLDTALDEIRNFMEL